MNSFKITTFTIITLSTSFLHAGVWESGRSATTNGFDITLNWSHTSAWGNYKICVDNDNSPCNGGTKYFTGSKPFIVSIPQCWSGTVRAKYEKFIGTIIFGKYIGYNTFKNDGKMSINTGALPGSYCPGAYNLTAEAHSISGSISMNGLPTVTEARACYKNSHSTQPSSHSDQCSMIWPVVTDGFYYFDTSVNPPEQKKSYGYHELSSKTAGAVRELSPTTNFSFSFSNLRSNCSYNIKTLFLNGSTVVAESSNTVKTGANPNGGGFFGGIGCILFASKSNKLTTTAPLSPVSKKQISFVINDVLKPKFNTKDLDILNELMLNNSRARVAVALFSEDGEADKYIARVAEIYRENPELSKNHITLANKYGMFKSLEKKNHNFLRDKNPVVYEALLQPEFFNIWQNDLSKFNASLDLRYLSKVLKNKELVNLIVSVSKDKTVLKRLLNAQ